VAKRESRPPEPVARRLLKRSEAADSLGMSLDTFERIVQPYVRYVQRGQLVLIPPPEIDRWVLENLHEPVRPDVGLDGA
jgi:hypothetical protein